MSKSFKTTYDRPPHRGLVCTLPSLVQPQFARETDINVMIQRALGGDPSVFARGASVCVDALSAPDDFHDAMNQLARGDSAWEELPQALKHSYGSKEAFLAAIDSLSASPVEEKKEEVKVDAGHNEIVTPVGAEASTPKSAE